MRYIGAGLVWFGYAGAVVAVAFGMHDSVASMATGVLGAFFAALARTHLKNGFEGETERISSRGCRRRNDSYWKYDEFREGGRAEIRRLEPKCVFEMGSSTSIVES